MNVFTVSTKVSKEIKDKINHFAICQSEIKGTKITNSDIIREAIYFYLKTKNNDDSNQISKYSKQEKIYNKMAYVNSLNSVQLLKSFIQNMLPPDEYDKVITAFQKDAEEAFNNDNKDI